MPEKFALTNLSPHRVESDTIEKDISKTGIKLGGVTWGRVTDRFPKIQSGSPIEKPKNGIFDIFRVFLLKIFRAAP